MGGSNAIGTLGYVRMMQEIAADQIGYDHIYCALGSGGTFAGIWLGRPLYNLKSDVHGIAVCDGTDYFVAELRRIQEEFQRWFDIQTDFDGVGRFIDERHVGLGYALNTADELRSLIRLAGTEGLVLDPVYTLKAFVGLTCHVKEGRIKPGARVLFIHTGGHYGIFPKHGELEKLLRK
jgi:D-cysteine desulfhydrase